MPALLQLVSFSLSVASTQLLDSVNARVVSGQRVALVGANGCGKSTLLRALAQPTRQDYYTVGTDGIKTALDPVHGILHVEQDALQWSRLLGGNETEMRSLPLPEAIEQSLAEGNEYALDDAEAWRRLSVAAHDSLEWRTACYDTTPLGQLSPGCAVRAYLAVAIQRPDIQLLLLDEPTNHLDLPSILWLQQTIRASGKTVLLVSHDAAFMDSVCDHVWAIDVDKKTLTVSGASYSDFRHAEEVQREQQAAAYDAQQKRHARLTAVADKLRAASAAGEHHIAKDNDKLQRDFKRDRAGSSGRKAKAVETMRDAQQRVERLSTHNPLRIAIEPLAAGTDSTIMLDSVSLGYSASEPLPLPLISLRIDFAERVAIVGFNGVGKSTLLRTLTRAIEPLAGGISIGRELRIGNLMQEHESMPRGMTPREHFAQLTNLSPFDAAKHLHRYGITRQQIDCPIGALNPGARARALLAGFSMRRVNTLILDEPTNHLDEEAVAEVVASLNSFVGTVIVVTHNRAFLEELQLTRLYRLGADGLTEIESIEGFVSHVEDAAAQVVAACGRE